jgi:hypothetical protein
LAFDPDAPLGGAGSGDERGAAELDRVGVGIPAPDVDDLGVVGEERFDGRVRGVAVEVEGVPTAVERVGGGLPLGAGGGGKEKKEGEKEERR